MDIYFSEKYPHAEHFYETAGGRVVAAAQAFPHTACIGGKEVKASYLSGLAVLPEFRGRGYAERIIQRMLRRLDEQGVAVSFLIPGEERLRDFYRQPRHGAYETTTYRVDYAVAEECPAARGLSIGSSTNADAALYDVYLSAAHAGLATLVLSASDFSAALASCRLDGGHVIVARRKEEVVGFCLAHPRPDGHCHLSEFVADSPARAAALMQWMRRAWNVETFGTNCTCPANFPEARPYAMARVVNLGIFKRHLLPLLDDKEEDGPPAEEMPPGRLAESLFKRFPISLNMMLDQ